VTLRLAFWFPDGASPAGRWRGPTVGISPARRPRSPSSPSPSDRPGPRRCTGVVGPPRRPRRSPCRRSRATSGRAPAPGRHRPLFARRRARRGGRVHRPAAASDAGRPGRPCGGPAARARMHLL